MTAASASRVARRLNSPGPVADKFVKSRAFICGCVGPVGSGKTIAALQKGIMVARKQKGVMREDGVLIRTARIGVIRESYPSLKSTTLKSWFRIIPEAEGKFNWQAPYVHKFRKILKREGNRRDGRPIDILECEFEFRAIGDLSVEEACRGWEVNAVIIDEADLQPANLVPFLTGRVGRFSDLDISLVVDPQIIVVLNMPDIENHIYTLLFDEASEVLGLTAEEAQILQETLGDRKLIEKFIQPGGREPDAENLHNLPGGRGYYVLQVAANRSTPGYVDRMVDNKPVPIQHGQAVNAGFAYTTHVQPCVWDPRRKLIIGVDQGLFAAAVALQRDWDNQVRTLAEVVNTARSASGNVSLTKIGPKAFAKRVKAMLADRFPGITNDMIRVVADPAAFAAKDQDAEENERDWLLIFEKELGLKVHRAKTNSAGLRNQAVWTAQDTRDGYPAEGGPEDQTIAGKALLVIAGLQADRLDLRDQISSLQGDLADAIARAERAETGEKKAKATLTKATAPVKLRKIGAVDAIEGDDDQTAIEKIRAAIGETDDVQIAFSDGTREVPGLSPVNVAGDAWKDHPNGLMLSEPVEIEGPGEGTSVTIDGYALVLDGKQFAYARRSTPLQIAPGQRMKISDDIIF